jgi:uncharacterized protein YegL
MGAEAKIQTLNQAIHEAIPHMRKVASENPNAQVLVRAIKFSGYAQWHVATPTPVEQFEWDDLNAETETAMGAAFELLAQQLRMPPMTDRALPPVLVLVSDGQPTDDYKTPLKELLALPWGRKAVRMAIAIGDDAERDVLSQFIANPEIQPLKAGNPEALVQYIRWVSTAVLSAAAQPKSQVGGGASVPVPELIPDSATDDVW